MSGYDAAQKTRENDDLGRWRFAAEISDVIRSTPPEWSARIGIFGKWGEGKSTVLHFLEAMLRPEGNIMFYFNPWAAQELDELWTEFGECFLEALELEHLAVESFAKEKARWLRGKIQSAGLTDGMAEVVEGTAEFFGKGKLYRGALGFVGKWLKPDGEQVKQIRERIGNKRVIVLIDDLDRATPQLLPKLLLSLREILNLPGFTFVLAFDDEIVAKGLVTANEAWGDGHSFLDKILDFHYFLPPVSKAAKRLLLQNMLERYCSFVPPTSVGPIEHLLPDNPRKLKALVRGLISLKSQVKRHGANELNWTEIWLAQMIRQESVPFFMRLLEGDTLSDLVGVSYRLRRHDSRKTFGREQEGDDADDVRKIIGEVSGINEKQRERLIELVNATRTLGGLHLAYNWRFALRPEAVTWKEFNELVDRWKKDPVVETISAWIGEHSKANSTDPDDIENELFEKFSNAKHNAAEEAAEAPTEEENASYCAKAEMLVTMTAQFLNLPKMFTPERFGSVYEKSLYWMAFRANQGDAKLRTAERALIDSLLGRATDDEACEMLDNLRPWDDWAFMPEDRETTKLKRDLRDKCVKRLLPKVERAFVRYLSRPECFRLLGSEQGSQAFRYILFHPERHPWGQVVRNGIFAILENATGEVNDSEKANDLLNSLIDAAQNKSSYIERPSAERIISDHEFIAALWHGATSRRIQFRMQQSYLWKRDILMQLGAREEDLPLSSELVSARERAKTTNVETNQAERNIEDTENLTSS